MTTILERLPQGLLIFFVFVSLAVLISYWMGFLLLNSPLIIILSLIGTYLLAKRFSLRVTIRKEVLIASLLMAALVAHPLLVIHPFYMGTNDSLHTIALRVLAEQGSIPATYQPYSDVSFTYTIGYHLFVKLFLDILPGADDFLYLWFFGVLFSALLPILAYLFSKEFFKSERAGLISAFLIVGTKFIFHDLFFGLFPRLMAFSLLLVFLIFYLRKNKLSYIVFPALFAVHPGVGLTLIIFLVFYTLFYRRLKDFLTHVPSLLLAAPSLIVTYSVLLVYFSNPLETVGGPVDLLTEFIALLLAMGWVPIILFILGTVQLVKKRGKERLLFFFLTTFAGGLYLLLLGKVRAVNVFVDLYNLTGMFFGSIVLAELVDQTKVRAVLKRMWMNRLRVIVGILTVFVVLSFFGSGYLTSLREGTKIDSASAEFSFAFRDFDPTLQPVLILSRSTSKIAEYSNKIPLDKRAGFYLPLTPAHLMVNEAFLTELKNQELKQHIIEDPLQYHSQADVKYIIVDSRFTDVELEYPVVFTYEDFLVYAP